MNPKYQLIWDTLQLPEFSGMNKSEFYAARNEKKNVRWNLVVKKIANNYIIGHLLDIKLDRAINAPASALLDDLRPAAGNISVREAARAGKNFLLTDTSDTIDGQNANTQGLVALLVMGGVWTQGDSDGFFNIFTSLHSDAEIEYGSDLTGNDYEVALLVPKYLQVKSLYDPAKNQTEIYETMMDQLSNGIDVDIEGD